MVNKREHKIFLTHKKDTKEFKMDLKLFTYLQLKLSDEKSRMCMLLLLLLLWQRNVEFDSGL